jgi:hypothetical protein
MTRRFREQARTQGDLPGLKNPRQPQINCGSGLARESAVTSNMNAD